MHSHSLQRSGFVITCNEAGAEFWSDAYALFEVTNFEAFQTVV